MACYGGNNTSGPIDVSTAVRAHAGAHYDFESETFIATTLRARDGSKGVDSDCADTLVPVAFDTTQITSPGNYSQPRAGDPCHPLAAGAHPPAVAFNWQGGGTQTTLGFDPASGICGNLSVGQTPAVATQMRVRRLTPRECERLQGFSDDHTLVPHGRRIKKEKLDMDFLKYQLRGNPKHLTRDDIDRLAADGPRYKAIGNSMAVPVMAWIGKRIQRIENGHE